MGQSLWLLPNAEPVGPWTRARLMLSEMPAGNLPLLVFRAQPDGATQTDLEKLGVGYFSLGKKGLNVLATWWKLKSLIRDHAIRRVHVWELKDLAICVLAANKSHSVTCEVSEGQQPPVLFKWWKKGLERVDGWFCRGSVPWVDLVKVRNVRGWVSGSIDDLSIRESANESRQVLLVADSPRAIREGLWAFDIFKHAWPDSRLVILASANVKEAAMNFSATLGLRAGIHYACDWSEVHANPNIFSVVVLGSGPWVGDVALRALARGIPVLAEENVAVGSLIQQGVPLQPVVSGDRAALAAALQKIAENGRESAGISRKFPRDLFAESDLPFYLKAAF